MAFKKNIHRDSPRGTAHNPLVPDSPLVDYLTEEEKHRFAMLVENSPDFIGIASLYGQTLYVNKAGRSLVGLEGSFDVGRTTLFDYVMEEDRAEMQERIIPDLVRNGFWKGEYRLRHFRTGDPIPVEVHSFVIKDSNTGQPVAINTIIRDITGRQSRQGAPFKDNKDFRKDIYYRVRLGDSVRESGPLAQTMSRAYEKLSAAYDRNAPAIVWAVSFIEQNIMERLTVGRIARSTNMSKFHFARVFKTLVGMSPMSFVIAVRIESAGEILKRSGLSVLDVAYSVGFNSVSHFTEQFRKFTGKTPTEYRRDAEDQRNIF